MLRLTKEREKRGWTKTKLARKAKTQLSHLSRVESGKQEPYGPVKERLSDVLDVPQDELFEEVENGGE